MNFAKVVIFLALSLGAAISNAAVPIFSDNFDSYVADQLNWNPTPASGWVVYSGNDLAHPGTVDLIGQGGQYDLLPGNGRYVDLDGSTNKSGGLSHRVDLLGGITYALSFSLAGNQRVVTLDHWNHPINEFVNAYFESADHTFMRATYDPFEKFSVLFRPSQNGNYGFGFKTDSNDNVGALLDNVSITAVPEPENYAMMLVGLGLIGFSLRKKIIVKNRSA